MSELSRPKVQLESPFGAPTRENIITNVAYALLAMRDSLGRGEAPFASHLLYTQMLDDQNPITTTCTWANTVTHSSTAAYQIGRAHV